MVSTLNMTQLDTPALSHRFMATFFVKRVPLAQSADMRFQRISGLGRELSVKSFREGGDNVGTHHLVEGVTHGNVVLERGVLPVTALSLLFNSAMGDFEFPRISQALGRAAPWAIKGVSLDSALDVAILLLRAVQTGSVPSQVSVPQMPVPVDFTSAPLALYNGALMPVCGWFLNDVLPVKWQTGELNANSNTVLVNTLELAYRKMTWLGAYA
ncbi:phage tail protein [Paraburkholderia aspalathi]|uniref:phage tail protein n=1 Tax=Paraburkholderia aspalathi TaxID=1324617 RepID=UPI0038B70F9A